MQMAELKEYQRVKGGGDFMERKSLSKKIRFEVFKRDNFTCQYCGNKAPQVTLEIDHINPVSKGGDNDILNLVTSCFDCNRGKSDRSLSDDTVIAQQQAQLEELNERRVQLEMMLDWRKELQDLDQDIANALISEIESVGDLEVLEDGKKKVLKWVKEFDLDILLDSIEISFLQYEDMGKAFNMIPRIAYYKAKPNKINDKLFYIRGILRNRLPYLNEKDVMSLLMRAEKAIGIEALKEIALNCNSWIVFQESLTDLMERVEDDG